MEKFRKIIQSSEQMKSNLEFNKLNRQPHGCYFLPTKSPPKIAPKNNAELYGIVKRDLEKYGIKIIPYDNNTYKLPENKNKKIHRGYKFEVIKVDSFENNQCSHLECDTKFNLSMYLWTYCHDNWLLTKHPNDAPENIVCISDKNHTFMIDLLVQLMEDQGIDWTSFNEDEIDLS